MHFLQNSQRERAEIENLHSHICINVISSSGRLALSPAFGALEQRGDECRQYESESGSNGVRKSEVYIYRCISISNNVPVLPEVQ